MVLRALAALSLSLLCASSRAQGAFMDLEPASAPASSLVLARCATGALSECFEAIRCGLKPADRSKVQLLGDGSILVDRKHPTSSANFASLRQAALSKTTTRLFLVRRTDQYEFLNSKCWPACELEPVTARMDDPEASFVGYTFFPFLGRRYEGVLHSVSEAIDVYALAEQSRNELAGTVFHELRHVIAGGFGQTPWLAGHNAAGVSKAASDAELEVAYNGADCL